ncbi:hypothetical protein Syun_022011 [Stephania yunnanensis]|uniref:Uncharacterized protein n=1 Tax=Stephania yunnanensis TaxID=152371 RepID=A0AAP0IGP0_9MAGN
MITYASTGRRSQLRYTENKWTMNLPADDGGLLKPDGVEGLQVSEVGVVGIVEAVSLVGVMEALGRWLRCLSR